MSTNTENKKMHVRLADYLPTDLEQYQTPEAKAAMSFFQGVFDILGCDPEFKGGDKTIEEFYPFMNDVSRTLSVSSKVWLCNQAGLNVTNQMVRQLKLNTDADRYLLWKLHYQIGLAGIDLTYTDGKPDGLIGNDDIIAKAILRMSLSATEQGIIEGLKAEVTQLASKYRSLRDVAKALYQNKVIYEPAVFYSLAAECRKTGWWKDLPDPTEDEILHTVKMEAPDTKAAYSITLDDVGDIVQYASSNAGFSISAIAELLGSTAFNSIKDSIINGAIDAIGGVAKTIILGNSEKISASLKSAPLFTVDTSVDTIRGLTKLLKLLIAGVYKIRDAKDKDGQLQAVDDLVKTLKDNKSVFEDEKFVELLKKLAEKEENKSIEESLPKASFAFDQLTQEEVKNVGMSMVPQVAFPLLKKEEVKIEDEDDKPKFLDIAKELKDTIDTIKGSKDKPDFVKHANEVPVVQQQTVSPKDIVPCNIYKEEGIDKGLPWVEQILNCARKIGGLNIKVAGVPSTINGQPTIVGIEFIVTQDLNFSVLVADKSFTIDIGYCLDARLKLFHNVKNPNGFIYMELCNAAYHVFNRDKTAINEDLFTKIFTFGFSGLNEADHKKYRMYNDNTMQLNRVICYNTIPTGSVSGEYRQGLKDSAFYMMKQLKEFGRINGIEIGRFQLTDFNKENMTYKLKNGIPFAGKLANAPVMEVIVSIALDKDNHVMFDKNNRAIAHYDITFAENVRFDRTLYYPSSANILSSPVDDGTGTTDDTEPIGEENEGIEVESDDDKPEFLKQ